MRSVILGAFVCVVTLVVSGPAWAGPNWADPTIYGTPVNLGAPVNSPGADTQPTLSGDELTLIFVAGGDYWGPRRPGSGISTDLWVTTRSSRSEPWAEPVLMSSAINREDMHETAPSLRTDGLELYIARIESLSLSSVHSLWVTTRASLNVPWTSAQKLPSWIHQWDYVAMPYLSPDGLSLYFRPLVSGEDDRVTTRADWASPWGTPVKLGLDLQTTRSPWFPCISSDGLSLLVTQRFSFSAFELWVTTRDTPDSPWKKPIKLPAPMNISGTASGGTWLSPDGTMLYFMSNRPGGLGDLDLWQVPILAPADFDRDRDVDGDDLKIFLACFSGPAVAYDAAQLPVGCTVTPAGQIIPPDFDRDADVDQDDFGLFQRCFRGAGKLSDPQCAN